MQIENIYVQYFSWKYLMKYIIYCISSIRFDYYTEIFISQFSKNRRISVVYRESICFITDLSTLSIARLNIGTGNIFSISRIVERQ